MNLVTSEKLQADWASQAFAVCQELGLNCTSFHQILFEVVKVDKTVNKLTNLAIIINCSFVQTVIQCWQRSKSIIHSFVITALISKWL